MSEPPNLDDLMGQLANGDRSVFTQVFEALWPTTLRLCVRLMGDEASAADAAQAAMIRILERASDYDRKRPAVPWAMAIATWECRTLLKRRSRLKESSDVPAVSDDGAAVEEQEQQLLVNAALNAMGTLSPADQETLAATYWDTAASASGSTLRKRRERAVTRLRDAFRRIYGLD